MTPIRILFALALISFAVEPGTCDAQSPTGAQPAVAEEARRVPERPSVVTRNAAPELGNRVFDLNISGGNLGETAELLREQIGDLNVVVPPSLLSTPLGPLVLRNVTIDSLQEIIQAATDGAVSVHFDGEALLTFAADTSGAQVRRSEPDCRILSLKHYLGDQPPEKANQSLQDLQDAVSVACDLLDRAKGESRGGTPKVSVHRATKLLVVVGPPERVAIVEQIVHQVSDGKVPLTPSGYGAGPYGGAGMGGAGSDLFGPGYSGMGDTGSMPSVGGFGAGRAAPGGITPASSAPGIPGGPFGR